MRFNTLLALLALTLVPAVAAAENENETTINAEASPSLAPRPLMAKKQNTSFLVGQIYVGGNVGFAVPLGLGRSDDELAFNDVAKTGFVINADVMRQMNQAIGLGAEVGYRKYGYNDKKTWGSLTRYGAFDASYQALDFDLTGRVFIGRQSIRPFIGILVGGELIMNNVDFTPSTQYSGAIAATQYKTTNLSVAYGVMSGAYFKAGRRTLLSLQVRLNFVPSLEDGTIEVKNNDDIQYIHQNQHGNQHNLTITLGLHVGTQKNNKH